jgi:hypothetical protein
MIKYTYGCANSSYSDLETALKHAKSHAHRYCQDQFVLQAVKLVKMPEIDCEVVDLVNEPKEETING